MKSELIKPNHLDRKAVVYIRQSSPQQVINNQESLRLQYALRQRARELGWHEADIDVIDADLGLSGAAASHRQGSKIWSRASRWEKSASSYRSRSRGWRATARIGIPCSTYAVIATV